MIATGNEAGVQVADAIEYLARQPEPKAIALFLESVRDPARFEQAIMAANAAGKPVVVLKVGSSEASAKAAQAHTGPLDRKSVVQDNSTSVRVDIGGRRVLKKTIRRHGKAKLDK